MSQLENKQQKPANLIENMELNTSMHHQLRCYRNVSLSLLPRIFLLSRCGFYLRVCPCFPKNLTSVYSCARLFIWRSCFLCTTLLRYLSSSYHLCFHKMFKASSCISCSWPWQAACRADRHSPLPASCVQFVLGNFMQALCYNLL